MEDLREEPELEEREEEEEEEEEEEDTQEPETDEKKDEPQEKEENQKEEKEDESNDQDGEFSLRPVRNRARRTSLTDELPDPDSTQCLLETNFSVTGLNEIKTERIISVANNTTKDIMPMRPMSLDLNAPVKLNKLRGEARPEKVTARLIDSDEVHFQSRNKNVAPTYFSQNK